MPTYSVPLVRRFFESTINLHVWAIRRVRKRQIKRKQSSNFCPEPANRLECDFLARQVYLTPLRERPSGVSLQSRG